METRWRPLQAETCSFSYYNIRSLINTCVFDHLPSSIRTIRQNIMKSMESREMLGQVHVASVGDVRDPHEVTVWKNWGYWNSYETINVAFDIWMFNFLDRNTFNRGRRERVKKKISAPPTPLAKGGLAKYLYIKSERLSLSCRVTWAWYERVNLYNRQIVRLPTKTKTYAT
jgi:hypothetical protein